MMNKTCNKLVAIVALLLLVSCKDKSVFSGYDRVETGAYMKFYERHSDGDKPRVGDGVTIEMAQYFNDTLLFSTKGGEPLYLVIQESDFIGDVPDALRMMHIGDSARLVVLSDSVFVHVMKVDLPEDYLGTPIYYELKLLSIKPMEAIEADRRFLLDSLRTVENDYLAGLAANPKNTITESGIIVMEKAGKGRLAHLGDYLNFDFTLCDVNGDTMINSFGIEPVEMQFGEEFICKGFNEALGMVPEGGTMRFVIPSALGFDSTGYERIIFPYDPLVVRLRMNAILDQAAYEAKQAQIQAEQEAEKQRLLSLEAQLISRYVKDNGIMVEPTESGIYIIPIEEGEGALAKWGDKVSVHYIMSNLNGDLIESSYDYETPISFTLGQGEMIPAIEEALMTMSPGARVKVVTPSGQAFGELEIDAELLPPCSPIVVELELVAVE